MREQDATLQYWSGRIDSLSEEYERAKTNTSHLRDQMESAWQSLHGIQEQYRDYKERANYEFQESKHYWSMHDKASAREHNENGRILNEKKAEIGSYLDGVHARFNSVKSQFHKAVSYQRDIETKLDQARNAYKSIIEELRSQNLQEQMHWKEKMSAEQEKRVTIMIPSGGKTYFEDKKVDEEISPARADSRSCQFAIC